jgi:hypothetical protein
VVQVQDVKCGKIVSLAYLYDYISISKRKFRLDNAKQLLKKSEKIRKNFGKHIWLLYIEIHINKQVQILSYHSAL